MSKLINISQIIPEGNIPSRLIDKLYNMCYKKSLNFDSYHNNSSLIGNITTNYTYKEYIDLIHEYFPNLIINSTNYFYFFKDPVQRRIVQEVYGDENGLVTPESLRVLTNLDDMFNHPDFNDIQILDLIPFKNYVFDLSQFITKSLSTPCPYMPTNVKYIFVWKACRVQLTYMKYMRPSLIYFYCKIPNQGSNGILGGSQSPSELWDVTTHTGNPNYNPPYNETIVIDDGTIYSSSFFSSFTWWTGNYTKNLYLNFNEEYTFNYTYGTNGKPNPSEYRIDNIYVPASVYAYYSEFFDQICDPTHIYEYDFELDPNNIMPNNVRIVL